MSDRSHDAERDWAAEKREFVADRRDEVAAERDAVAQVREEAADAREVAADEWERRLVARADESGRPSAPDVTQLTEARAARHQSRRDRDETIDDRDTAAADREQATERRHAENPSLRLATAFAAIAAHLYASDSYDEVLQRIAETAVSTVNGCEMASITINEGGSYRTACNTNLDAASADDAQYEAQEGPCLDAVHTPVVYAPSFPDGRWPTLASRPTDFGVESVLSHRLTPADGSAANSSGGSLNSYGVVANAFDEEAQEIGLILAAHASVAAQSVHERSVLQQIDQNLNTALLSRDVIGQAKGILMERLSLPPEDAFDALRRSSQRLNEKLRDVARRLAETGQFDRRDVGDQLKAGSDGTSGRRPAV